MFLFGGTEPWSPSDWTSSDDRVRGGASHSYLDCISSSAVFYGNLDITTLGGAGFASQRTAHTSRTWNLSGYDGIELDIAATDSKRYTLILKNDVLSQRPDGREQSSVSYEYDFIATSPAKLFIAWHDFRATYRGREVEGPPLDVQRVKRFAVMMRSFFGEQEGDFRLCIRSLAAVKNSSSSSLEQHHNEPYLDDPLDESTGSYTEKAIPNRQGWAGWAFSGCGFL